MLRRLCGFAAVVAVACFASTLSAQTCEEDFDLYNGYLVKRVEIRTPIAFFAAAVFGFDQLKVRLPLQENQPFSLGKLSAGTSIVRDELRASGSDSTQALKIVVVTGKPIDCDPNTRSLSVVYSVFTNVYRPYLSHTFEQRTAEVQRPASTGAEGGTTGRFLVKPSGGYNHTRHGYGGIDFSARLPIAAIRQIDVFSSVSSNSTIDTLHAIGDWEPRTTVLQHADWGVGFRYLDLPAGPAKLKTGKLSAQFSGSTKEVSALREVFRFGAALEGGHQQTDFAPSSTFPNTGFGAIKLFSGVTGRAARQTFTASYGLELGSTLTGGQLDFTKHLIDLGFSTRFLRQAATSTLSTETVHRPLDLELRASGGIIQGTVIPPPDRFFGGNQVQNFIEGQTWVIPNGAFIRSIPENRLGTSFSSVVLGGTRFYSANMTISKVIWGRSLLPTELARDPDFLPALQGAIATAKGTLTDYYKSKDPAFSAAHSELTRLGNTVQQIGNELDQVSSVTSRTEPLSAAWRAVNARVGTVRRIVSTGKNTQIAGLVHLQLPNLEREMASLEELLRTIDGQSSHVTSFSALRQAITESRQTLQSDLATVDTKGAETRANADFSSAERVLNAFLHELNIYSIAPVAIFDVARVWPAGSGVHYAAGGGLRLSLVNVNFTLAYAANPVRQTGEGSGALFMSLDVSDLFH